MYGLDYFLDHHASCSPPPPLISLTQSTFFPATSSISFDLSLYLFVPLRFHTTLTSFSSFCSSLTFFVSLLSLLTLTYFVSSNATCPKHSRPRLSSYLFHLPFFFLSYFSSILLYQKCSYKGFWMYLRALCSVSNDQHLPPLPVCALSCLVLNHFTPSFSTRVYHFCPLGYGP